MLLELLRPFFGFLPNSHPLREDLMTDLTKSEREQIAEILKRRANDIASHMRTVIKDGEPASVEFALTREIDRLRRFAVRVNPPAPEVGDDD